MAYTEGIIMDYIKKSLGCNENQAKVVYKLAYEYGHSNGMSEVYIYARDLCDMIIELDWRI